MRVRIALCILAASVFAPLSAATAQGQPFLFVRTPFAGTSERPSVSYDMAYGERTFGPIGTEGLNQLAMARTQFAARFAISAAARMELTGGEHGITSEAELEWSASGGPTARMPVAVGFGVRREVGPVTVLTTRLSANRGWSKSLVGANVLLERPLNGERDAIDVITSAGFARQLSRGVRLGIEAIGQDLEGFWEEDEAEGGAALFFGPSLVLTPSAGSWSLAFGAGPALHVTHSSRLSGAPRDVPNGTRSGYVVRTSFRYHPGR